MKLGERMVDGVFLERPNRYLAQVEIEGRRVSAHVPDPGRLPGLMIPQRRVRLIYNPRAKRSLLKFSGLADLFCFHVPLHSLFTTRPCPIGKETV